MGEANEIRSGGPRLDRTFEAKGEFEVRGATACASASASTMNTATADQSPCHAGTCVQASYVLAPQRWAHPVEGNN